MRSPADFFFATMLRITTRIDAAGAVFQLEGKLAGPWVRELEDCWRSIGDLDRPMKVLLSSVTFIDEKGIALLAEMHRHGAELVAEGCMNKAVVEQIVQRQQ